MALKGKARGIRDYSRVANSRLYQLEKAGYSTSPLERVYLESKTNKDIFRVTESGKVRFRTDLTNLSEKQQNKLKEELDKFLNNPWSQKGHLEYIINKTDEDTSHVLKLGEMSKKDALKIYNSLAYNSLSSFYGSSQLNEQIEKLNLKGMTKTQILDLLNDLSEEELMSNVEIRFEEINKQLDKENSKFESIGNSKTFNNVYEMFTRGIGDR